MLLRAMSRANRSGAYEQYALAAVLLRQRLVRRAEAWQATVHELLLLPAHISIERKMSA
jgi:hypothetical protein